MGNGICIFCGTDDRVRVTEAERCDVDEGVCRLHGGGQGFCIGYIAQCPVDFKSIQRRTVTGGTIKTVDIESVFEDLSTLQVSLTSTYHPSPDPAAGK